jgi:hypothetical protein
MQTVGETVGATLALVTLDAGAQRWDATPAPARRVHLPFTNAETSQLTADGQTLMQRAIEWAGGLGCGSLKPLLLVVGNATTLSSKDEGMKALMESWCYGVIVIDDGDSQALFDAAAAAADVVYVSGTTSGSSLQDKLTGSPTPIVNEINGKLDNFGFSSSTASSVTDSAFSVTDAAHYISEPFAGNPVTFFTTDLAMPVPGGTLAPGLQTVGETAGATPALVTLDAGAQRWDATPAPARRVHLPFTNAETSQLTADGQTLMQRAIEWAVGAGSGGGCAVTILDAFNAVGYSGSDADPLWVGDWVEFGDSGSPTSQDERVVADTSGFKLRIADNDNGGFGGNGEGVWREVDLSGMSTATLSYKFQRNGLDNSNDAGSLFVSGDGGTSWSPELWRTEGPGTDTAYQQVDIDISAYIASNTRIRFQTGTGNRGNDLVYFDDVTICAN